MDQRNRPLRFATGLVLVATTALVLVEWPRIRDRYRPTHAALPAPDEIVGMRAAVWAAGSRGNLETDVPWFEVPDLVARRIWRRFEPNEHVSRPPVDPKAPLGELDATAADGRVIRVRFYESGSDDLIFTPDGKNFFRSEPRNDRGHPLGGGLSLAGTLRYADATSELPRWGPSAPGPAE